MEAGLPAWDLFADRVGPGETTAAVIALDMRPRRG